MKKVFFSTLALMLFLCPNAKAFDDLTSKFTMDYLFLNSRTSRLTSGQNLNFLANVGAMVQMEYTARLGLFSRYYIGGDVAFYNYETNQPTILTNGQQTPFQIYVGAAQQFGNLKNFELFFGAGGSTEYYQDQQATNTFSNESELSARIHAGFTYRLISVVGSVAQLLGRYSYPVTSVNHSNGTVGVTYLGILDGTFRLKFHYDSVWSLYGGIRFEDFSTEANTEYFTTRIYAGIGFHL